MLFADIDLLDENLDFRSHCWVGVRDGRVAYVGDAAPAGEEAARYGEVYDGRGKLLCPAFYNAHAHAPMTLLRGYTENLPLQAWLNDMVSVSYTHLDVYKRQRSTPCTWRSAARRTT